MRPDPPIPSRSNPRCSTSSFTAAAFALAGLLALASVAAAQTNPGAPPAPAVVATAPAFGDSNWVAPLPAGALDPAPTDPGPRVAEKDHEPVGETVLRTPFRLLVFPLRLLARGMEGMAGVAGESFIPRTRHFGAEEPSITVTPVFAYDGAPGPAVGLKVTNHFAPAHDGVVSVAGTYSLWDMRKLYAAFHYGRPDERWGFHGNANYRLRPNESHYGLGNYSVRSNKSIWLQEQGRVDLTVKYGTPRHQLQWFTGWQSVSARRGWNGSPGVLDVLPLEQAPGMLDESQVLAFGPGIDLAQVDNLINPTLGIHARANLTQVNELDGDFNYQRAHLEGRAYVPVFSRRRVLAFRAFHQWINPDADEVVPFYLLPDPTNPFHLAAYSAHRFRDNHLAVGRGEYRWLIWEDRLWAVAIAEIAQVASSADQLRIADVHESYGAGLRLAFRGTVVRATYAKGDEKPLIWFALGQDF